MTKELTCLFRISTVLLYLEYVNPDMAFELLHDKEFMQRRLEHAETELMIASAVEDEKEMDRYYLAVHDFKTWIKELD